MDPTTQSPSSAAAPPPAPPTTATPRRAPARRSSTDRHIGGVSTAVAGYVGVSVGVARILLALSVLLGCLGVVIYAALWLFVPDDEGRVLIQGQAASSVESIGASLLSGVSTLCMTAWVTRDGPNWLVALLVTVGVFILSRRGAVAAGPPPTPPAPTPPGPSGPPAPPAPVAWAPSVEDTAVGEIVPDEIVPAEEPAVLPLDDPTATWSRDLPPRRSAAATVVASKPPKPPKPPKPMPFLGPLTVSIAVAMAGSLVLLDAIGAFEVQASDILIAALIIVGLGLLVSTWFGRARGLVLVGLVLIPFVAVSAVVDRIDLHGGVGDRNWTPQTPDGLASSYRLGAGSMQLDLTHMDLTGAAQDAPFLHTSMSLGTGQLQLVVPEDWTIDVRSTVDIGTVWSYSGGEVNSADSLKDFGAGEYRDDLVNGTDWFFSERSEVPNDPGDQSGNVRSLHVEGVEGAPELDVDTDLDIGIVEVFRVAS